MTVVEKVARGMWDWEMQTQMFRMFDDQSADVKQTFMFRARGAIIAMKDSFADPVVRAAIQAALDEGSAA